MRVTERDLASRAPAGQAAAAPPGFEEPKPRGNSYSIKGRKVKSFHGPEYYSKEDEPFTITRGGGKIASEDHHEKPKAHEAPAVVSATPAQSFAAVASHAPAPQNNSAAAGDRNRISKSQSLHSGINALTEEEEPKEIPPTSNPNGRGLRPSVSSVDSKNKQKTMTAEEAAQRKKGGLTKSVSMPLLSNLGNNLWRPCLTR